MTSIAELFPKCNKLAYDARQQLQQLSSSAGRFSSGRSSSAADDLNMVLDELERQLTMMETDLVVREPAGPTREKWKRKIRDLRMDAQRMRDQGRSVVAAAAGSRTPLGARYQSERSEVLRQRRGGGRGAAGAGAGAESDLQTLAAEGESLESSHRMVNSLIDQGSANLSNLQSQRQQLRGVRGVLNDINNRLGLTQSTMRIIERRDITDAYLVAAGMVVTCLVIYFVWF